MKLPFLPGNSPIGQKDGGGNMERELFFHILGIEETKEEGEIRKAYREKLKGTNPEDNQTGYT